ncbi:JAB domain-containing protein [Aquirufa nivalisilvae]
MKHSDFVAEIQLKYIPTDIKRRDLGSIRSSVDGYNFLYPLYDLDTIGLTEVFIVVFLNRACRVIGYNIHSVGGITGTVVDIKLIAATALKCACSSILISHNHPSGNLEPSKNDKAETNLLIKALQLFNIEMLDHIILSPEFGKYYSFKDEFIT